MVVQEAWSLLKHLCKGKKNPLFIPTSPKGCLSNRWQAAWNHTAHKVEKTHKQNMKQRKTSRFILLFFSSYVGCWGGVFVLRCCFVQDLLPNPLVCALSLLFAVVPVIQFLPPRPQASIASVLWQDADPQNSCWGDVFGEGMGMNGCS